MSIKAHIYSYFSSRLLVQAFWNPESHCYMVYGYTEHLRHLISAKKDSDMIFLPFFRSKMEEDNIPRPLQEGASLRAGAGGRNIRLCHNL